MRMVGEVRGEQTALFVCRTPEGRLERKGILLELDRDGIRHDAIRLGGGSWRGNLRGHFARGESTSTELAPKILSSSRRNPFSETGIAAKPFAGKSA